MSIRSKSRQQPQHPIHHFNNNSNCRKIPTIPLDLLKTTFNMRLSTSTLLLACTVAAPGTNAWMPTTQTRSTTSLQAAISRQDFFQQAAATAVVSASVAGIWNPTAAMSADEVISLPNGVTYTVVKKGTGPQPSIGELAAIRFKAYFGETKIDDIFDTPEPYYTRVGSGAMLKGVEEVLPMMVLGDRWVLTIPVSTVFLVQIVGCGKYVLSYVCVCHLMMHGLESTKTCSHLVFIILFLNNNSPTWRLAKRDAHRRQASPEFPLIPSLLLTWKLWVCQARNQS